MVPPLFGTFMSRWGTDSFLDGGEPKSENEGEDFDFAAGAGSVVFLVGGGPKSANEGEGFDFSAGTGVGASVFLGEGPNRENDFAEAGTFLTAGAGVGVDTAFAFGAGAEKKENVFAAGRFAAGAGAGAGPGLGFGEEKNEKAEPSFFLDAEDSADTGAGEILVLDAGFGAGEKNENAGVDGFFRAGVFFTG